MHLFSVGNSSGYYLWQPAVTVSLHSCSMQRSGTMGSISGTSIVSLMLLLGEGKKPWCPLGDGLWKDWLLKRAAPEKDGAAMPGEWARLEGRVGKEKGEKSKFKRVQVSFSTIGLAAGECFDQQVYDFFVSCALLHKDRQTHFWPQERCHTLFFQLQRV